MPSSHVPRRYGVPSVNVKLGRELRRGPLQDGDPAMAPYDLILIDGAVEYIPDALIDQLVDGGRLGGAIVDKGITRLFVGRKVGGGFGQISIADMATPALPGFERPRVFTF